LRAISVNRELLLFYWQLGGEIVAKQAELELKSLIFEIPWGQNRLIVESCRSLDEAKRRDA